MPKKTKSTKKKKTTKTVVQKKGTTKSKAKAKPTAKAKSTAKKIPLSSVYNSNSVYCVVNAGDITRASKFYSEVLELKPSLPEDFPATEAGWFEFHLPVKGAKLGLSLIREGKVPPINSLGIVVTDIDAMHNMLNSKKAKPTKIQDIPNMISTFDIKDSEGNSVTFIGDPRVKG